MNRLLSFFLAAILLPCLTFGQISITVQNTNESGPGSLNQAMLDIFEGGVITFDSAVEAQRMPFVGDGLVVDKSFTIDGGGLDINLVDDDPFGGPDPPLMEVSASTLTLMNLWIGNYYSAFEFPSIGRVKIDNGGKVFLENVEFNCFESCFEVNSGELSVIDSEVVSYYSGAGVLVNESGTVNILRSELVGYLDFGQYPGAFSLGIRSGEVIVQDSRLGPIRQSGGLLELYESVVYGPYHTFGVPAFDSQGGSFKIYRSELTGEEALYSAGLGEIYSSILSRQPSDAAPWNKTMRCTDGSLLIANSTIVSAYSPFEPDSESINFETSCDLDLYSSLVLGDPAITGPAGEASGDFGNAYNLFSDPNLTLWTDPLLIAHRSPSFKSPMVDKGDCALYAVELDLSGDPRPYDTSISNAAGGDGCDIGAFERQDLTPHGNEIDIDLVLSGAWDETEMSTELLAQGLIPLNQPYEDVPDVSVDASFLSAHPEIVDWIWIQPNRSIYSDSKGAKRAVFLTKDGNILSPDGSLGSYFFYGIYSSYYLIVGHRNHLSVMSSNRLALSDGEVAKVYFRSELGNAYSSGGLAMQELGTNIFGLWGGDGDGNKQVTAFDFLNHWLPNNGGPAGYSQEDYNLSGSATALDFLDVWLPANGQSGQIPD